MYTNAAAYLFTRIDDPASLADALRVRGESLDLRGTVLVAGEGLNLFLAGTASAVASFVAALRHDPRFASMAVRLSHSPARAFARFKVKVKPEIISFRQPQASPLQERAPGVAPHALARWIAQGTDDQGRRLVLLDTRNREEVAVGTFDGALALPIDRFTDLPEAVLPLRDELADATVVAFCTGGIRCEKAALWMRAQGMANVLQLEGGILGYFEAVGGAGYAGDCFVFDGRGALDPTLAPALPAAPASRGASHARVDGRALAAPDPEAEAPVRVRVGGSTSAARHALMRVAKRAASGYCE